MIVGLILGLIFIDAMFEINTGIFRDFIRSSNATGWISQTVWCVLFTALSYTIVNVGFKLITRLPLEVFALIGNRGGLFIDDSGSDRSGGVFSRLPGHGHGAGTRHRVPRAGSIKS